jgi:hypothetical protein
MPMLFANHAASRSWHISSQKIAQGDKKIMFISVVIKYYLTTGFLSS